MKNESFPVKRLFLASLLAESLIHPFGTITGALPARLAIFSGGLIFFALTMLFLVYSAAVQKVPNRWITVILCAAMLLSTAMELRQGQKFYSYVMDRQLVPIAFLLLVLSAAYYGAHAGLATLERTAGIIFAVVFLSLSALLISIWPKLSFSHLQTDSINFKQVVQTAGIHFYLPPALVLIPHLNSSKKTAHEGVRLLFIAFAIGCALQMLGEMTLGNAYAGQQQPLYTVARLGGISVFRRLDAIHVSVWLLLFILKVSFYIASICCLWKIKFPTHSSSNVRMISILGILLCLMAIRRMDERTVFAVQQGLLFVGMLLSMLYRRRRAQTK